MNTDVNTQNKNLRDFFKNPLIIISAIPVVILWLINSVVSPQQFLYSFNDLFDSNFFLGSSGLFSALFSSLDSIMHLILGVALVLLFFFARKSISFKAPLILLKVFAILSMCIGAIQMIYSIIITIVVSSDVLYNVGTIVVEGDDNSILALVSYGLDLIIGYVLPAIGVLFFVSAIKKGVAENVIYKKSVIVFVATYVVYLIPRLELLWMYVRFFTQAGGVSYYSFLPLLKSIYAVLFIIIGIMYLTFFRVKTEDEFDDMEYEAVEESVEEITEEIVQ